MRKILVIEDEYENLGRQLQYANLRDFGGNFIFTNIRKIDATVTDVFLKSFDGVIVDIALDVGSTRDGFGIIEMLDKIGYEMKRVCILTGNAVAKEYLVQKKLPIVEIYYKPIGIETVNRILSQFRKT